MPTACILRSESHVHLKSERLSVLGRNEQTGREEVLREIPIRDLDRLILSESVQITSAALAALMRADIPVNLLAWNGQCLGGFLPATNRHGQARLRQYRRTLDSASPSPWPAGSSPPSTTISVASSSGSTPPARFEPFLMN